MLIIVVTALHAFPTLSDPDKWIDDRYVPILSTVPEPVWWLVVLVGSAQLGSWWSGIMAALAMLGARLLVAGAPLQLPVEAWGSWRRRLVRIVAPASALRSLREEMLRADDYADLERMDRPGAFREFLRHAAGPNPPAIAGEIESQAVVRAWIDLRLSCGLLLIIPLACLVLPWAVDTTGSHARVWAAGFAALSFLLLLGESVTRIRRAVEASILNGLNPQTMGRCARAAAGSGRSVQDTDAATNRLD